MILKDVTESNTLLHSVEANKFNQFGMCGRGRCSLAPEILENRVNIPRNKWKNRERYQPTYNIGPGGWLPIIRNSEDNGRVLQTAKWGLIPSYHKKGAKINSFRMFNARSERLSESPVFKRLISSKRCVVLMNGFYEWKKETAKLKQPYYLHRGEENLVKFAGLFDLWEGEDGVLCSTTIITTSSSPRLKWLHLRMPVILPNDEAVDKWLATEDIQWKELQNLLTPYNGEDLVFYPVTSEVGKISFQGNKCVVDISKQGISSFLEVDNSRPSNKQGTSAEQKADSRLRKISQTNEKEIHEEEHDDEQDELIRTKRRKFEAVARKDTKRERYDESEEAVPAEKKMKKKPIVKVAAKRGHLITKESSPVSKRVKSPTSDRKEVHSPERRKSARLLAKRK